MSRFRAVIFDVGDTLFHSPSGVEMMVGAGVERALAQRLWEDIWTASKTAEELAKGRDLSPARHRECWMSLLERVEPHAPGLTPALYGCVWWSERWLPYPDAAGVLAALRDGGVRVGALSNIPASLRPVFEHHGLAARVDVYVESVHHGREKPDPELFRIACRELGVEPAEALMVGDSHLADGAAVLAGLTALLLPPAPPGAVRGLDAVLGLCGLYQHSPVQPR